ncbi:MAG: glucose-1-phosphate adenylyltransferase [Clostridia bacterium]|nr:glucose-1-phosphate adenylyltransferase [Clostridia bacterium]
MTNKKDCVTMLLAGGQGSRLYVLTEKKAKPALPFGGKYRIIDYALSNCVNSGLDTVGVLTQYQPLLLNEYIGNGQPWDLDRLSGGVNILPPYQKFGGSDWYSGTANAVYQNIPFIERYNPDHVLILSGDHIYKMDYSKMLAYHKKKDAACSIAVIDVPLHEASRFGIINTDEDNKILEFEEKPANPKSTKASMGIYIFKWSCLKKYLMEDSENPKSSNDFGKDVLPHILECGEKMYAYCFDGYWKDVGTIDSLWQANMDLLEEDMVGGSEWKIYSRSMEKPPHYISKNAVVKNSIVSEGCEIYGDVENCVLFPSVTVKEGACLRDSIVMADTVIGKNSCINYSIIDEEVNIGEDCRIGEKKSSLAEITVIAEGLILKNNCIVPSGAMIDSNIN